MHVCLSYNKNIPMTMMMMEKVEGFCSVWNWINAKAQKSSLTSTWVNEDFALKCKLVLKINECLFSCSLCCSRKLKCFHGPPLQKQKIKNTMSTIFITATVKSLQIICFFTISKHTCMCIACNYERLME